MTWQGETNLHTNSLSSSSSSSAAAAHAKPSSSSSNNAAATADPLPSDGIHVERLRALTLGLKTPFVITGHLKLAAAPAIVLGDDPTPVVLKPTTLYRASKQAEDEGTARLLSALPPAPFGKGSETKYDPAVRNALQLRADGGAFTLANFDPDEAGITRLVAKALFPASRAADECSVVAELYSLNVYSKGGHFVAHKDTPRGDDFFGTLVVGLPAAHSGGVLQFEHNGMTAECSMTPPCKYTGTGQPSPNTVTWAAFYGDVVHAVTPVREGVRVTVAYILCYGSKASQAQMAAAAADTASSSSSSSAPASPPSSPLHDDVPPAATDGSVVPETKKQLFMRECFRDALSDDAFYPRGVLLKWRTSHMYTNATFGAGFRGSKPLTHDQVLRLLGSDATIGRAAAQAGLDVYVRPRVRLASDWGDGEFWETEKFLTKLPKRVNGEEPRFRGLVEHAPNFQEVSVVENRVMDAPGRYFVHHGEDDQKPVLHTFNGAQEDGAEESLGYSEYSATGYFGNEGCGALFYSDAYLCVKVPPVGSARSALCDQGVVTLKGKKRRASSSASGPRKSSQSPAVAGLYADLTRTVRTQAFRTLIKNNIAELPKLTGVQLKELCRATGNTVSGNKTELIGRLMAYPMGPPRKKKKPAKKKAGGRRRRLLGGWGGFGGGGMDLFW